MQRHYLKAVAGTWTMMVARTRLKKEGAGLGRGTHSSPGTETDVAAGAT